MGSNPVNLAMRFLLELTALISAGIWDWNLLGGWPRFFLSIGIPVVLAVIWGVFAVRNDPSRSGKAPVAVSGIVRLVLELGIFAFAVWAFQDLGYIRISWIFGIVLAIHYVISYDRIIWLINHGNPQSQEKHNN